MHPAGPRLGAQGSPAALGALAAEWRERLRFLLRLLAAAPGGAADAAGLRDLGACLDFNGFYTMG